MKKVVYTGSLLEITFPKLKLMMRRGEPKEVDDVVAEVLLSNPDFKLAKDKASKVTNEEVTTEEGGE